MGHACCVRVVRRPSGVFFSRFGACVDDCETAARAVAWWRRVGRPRGRLLCECLRPDGGPCGTGAWRGGAGKSDGRWVRGDTVRPERRRSVGRNPRQGRGRGLVEGPECSALCRCGNKGVGRGGRRGASTRELSAGDSHQCDRGEGGGSVCSPAGMRGRCDPWCLA